MLAMQTILHPTDFSENSRYAFQMACALARDYQATLLLLHVTYPSSDPLSQVPLPESGKTLDSFPWPRPADPRIRVERQLAEGDFAEEILRLARTRHCDLIVMGTHGRTGLSRLLTGSVAEEVLRKAACPVLAVKAPFREAGDVEPEIIAGPGELVDARPLGPALACASSMTLVRTPVVEVARLVVRAGEEVPERASQADVVLQCLEGRVQVVALGKSQTLEGGQLLDLPAGEPYRLKGIEDASLLLTLLLPKD